MANVMHGPANCPECLGQVLRQLFIYWLATVCRVWHGQETPWVIACLKGDQPRW